jgi:hypothetical protein
LVLAAHPRPRVSAESLVGRLRDVTLVPQLASVERPWDVEADEAVAPSKAWPAQRPPKGATPNEAPVLGKTGGTGVWTQAGSDSH